MDALYIGLGAFTVAFLVLATIKLVRRARAAPKASTLMLAHQYAVTSEPGETDAQLRDRVLRAARDSARYPREL